MAIKSYTEEAFAQKLDLVLSASRPIQSEEHLFGRDQELDRIKKALYISGRHVFIYGDRGVGKSSLAATAANQYQSADSEYLDIGCGPDSTLFGIVANIAYQAMSASRLNKSKVTTTAGIEFKFLRFSQSSEITRYDLHAEIHSLMDAVEVLKEVAALHSQKPIVVLDEFDRISDQSQRELFADLLKQIGDKKVGLKFIFTGVAKTLSEILTAHHSAIRQLETVELSRLSWEGRWEIIDSAINAFGLTIDKEVRIRIAAVSDGFPFYVHLLMEKILWAIFENPELLTHIEADHYQIGLANAIASINAELKRPYELVMNRPSGELEEILWSTADSEFLDRYLADMYESYKYVIKQRRGSETVEYQKYGNLIRSLKTIKFEEILIADPNRPGLYAYREKMFRGYVRMQAESHGVELAGEAVEKATKQVMHVAASAGRGYRGSKPPPGVNMGRKRNGNISNEE
ncbi:MAG: ATP-binding protein [Burkholderiaceae bacterium]